MRLFIHALCVLCFFSFQLKGQSEFILKGTSKLLVKNQSSDSIHFVLDNWVYLPSSYHEQFDTLLLPNQDINLTLITQSKHYFDLKLDHHDIRMFTEPSIENEMIIQGDTHQVQFFGKYKLINEFLTKRNTASDYLPRAYWFQGGSSVADLIIAFDSITDLQKIQLNKYNYLPKWYKEFESLRLDYVNAESKLNAVSYRKQMLQLNDSISEDFLSQVVGKLSVERIDLVGVMHYMMFLRSYINYMPKPFSKKTETTNLQEQGTINRIISVEENLSTQTIKDIFLSEYFTHLIDKRRHIWNDAWIKHIIDPELSNFVTNQVLKKTILPSGANLPYFYLKNVDSKVYAPKDFEGKIILINFWATWCKPCYKEFNYENELVEIFKNEPVEIINICIQSDQEQWKKVINSYELKTLNLFAEGNWSQNITESFGTSSLPHSVLIDWNGKVVQNKCQRPSENVDKIIAELLDKMKNGVKGY